MNPSAQVHNRGGAVDLVRVVRLTAALGEMEEIDGRENGHSGRWPQAEHEQWVGEVMPVEVDDIPRAVDDRLDWKPGCNLTEATRQEGDRH